MSKVYFDSNGATGNIFWIMGATSEALREEGREEDAKEMCDKVIQQDNYEDALAVIREYVELIDVSRET